MRAVFRKFVLAFVLVALLVQQQREAKAQVLQALEALEYTGVINDLVAWAVNANLLRQGVAVGSAAAVAAIAATYAAMGSVILAAGGSNASVASVQGDPVWLASMLGLGGMPEPGLSFGGYTMKANLGSSGAASSLTMTPNYVEQSYAPIGYGTQCGEPSGTPTDTPGVYHCWQSAVSQGAPVYRSSTCATGALCQGLPVVPSGNLGWSWVLPDGGEVLWADDPAVFAKWWVFLNDPWDGQSAATTQDPSAQYVWSLASYDVVADASGNAYVDIVVNVGSTGAVSTYDQGDAGLGSPGVELPLGGSLDQLAPDVTEDMLNLPVDPNAIASMVNSAWQTAAAQPGYQGEPFNPAVPVDGADVGQEGSTATWGDLLSSPAPLGATSGTTTGVVPISPTASSAPSGPASGATGTNPASGGSGASGTSGSGGICAVDPTAAACAALGTASASGAVGASSVSVSLTPWSIGPDTGTCPAPLVVTVFGQALSFDYGPLCLLAGQLQPVFLSLCALAAAYIVAMGIKS